MRIALIALLCLAGCVGSGAKSPERFQARATVAIVATAVQASGDFCASVAGTWKSAGDERWKPLAQKCSLAYSAAHGAIVAAAAGFDAYDEAKAGQIACAVLSALDGVDATVSTLEAVGVAVPETVKSLAADAHQAAAWAGKVSGGVCYAPPGDAANGS